MRRISVLVIAVYSLLNSCKSDNTVAGGSNGGNQTGLTNVGVQVAFPSLTFTLPLAIVDPNDGTNRLFVEEQDGRILSFENSSTATSVDTFLNITDRVARQGQEEGLLGLAFDPGYSSDGYFYVNYTTPSPLRSRVSRFHVPSGTPNRADAGSELILLEYNQPFSNHNGGCLQFGPDGDLYIGVGDGGSGGDPLGNGQSKTTVLGKILRLDVRHATSSATYAIPPDNPFVSDTGGVRKEIYALGLRNPWRFSFDPEDGRLWCADVGQDKWEEIDLIEKGKNYGWNVMEGLHCFNPAVNCNSTGLTMPIWEYGHAIGQCITGGYVYRGGSVPALSGMYIYADFIAGQIWGLQYSPSHPPTNVLIQQTGLLISSFGVDHTNELYICAFDGKIYRLVTK